MVATGGGNNEKSEKTCRRTDLAQVTPCPRLFSDIQISSCDATSIWFTCVFDETWVAQGVLAGTLRLVLVSGCQSRVDMWRVPWEIRSHVITQLNHHANWRSRSRPPSQVVILGGGLEFPQDNTVFIGHDSSEYPKVPVMKLSHIKGDSSPVASGSSWPSLQEV
jgi:hypothetical protein